MEIEEWEILSCATCGEAEDECVCPSCETLKIIQNRDMEERFNWTIKNKRTNEKIGYSSLFRPVNEEHVRNSPSVKRWAGDDEIEVLPELFEGKN